MDKTVKWVPNIENKLIILYFVIILFSSVLAFRSSTSWAYMDQFINWFLLYFLVVNIVNSERRLFIFTLAYLLFSFKMSQHGFFTWALRGFTFTNWGLIGAAGWFQNSGEFAIQMLIFGALSASFVVALRDYWGRYMKWFFYFMPFTAIMSVLGSSSRGAQVALVMMGGLLLLKAKSGFKTMLVLSVLAVAILQFMPEEQMQRFSSMGEDRTSTQRLFYWEAGLDFWADNPILGVGYANWMDYYKFAKPQATAEGLISASHNIFIQVSAELGLAGLMCFLFMTLYIFILNARTRKNAKILENKFLYYMSFGLDSGLVGFLIAGFFVTVMYYPFFWVQLAFTVALYSITKNQLALVERDPPVQGVGSGKRNA